MHCEHLPMRIGQFEKCVSLSHYLDQDSSSWPPLLSRSRSQRRHDARKKKQDLRAKGYRGILFC